MDYYNSKLQVLIDRLGGAFSYNDVYPIMETLKQGYNTDSVATLAMQLIDLSIWLLDQRELLDKERYRETKNARRKKDRKGDCSSILDVNMNDISKKPLQLQNVNSERKDNNQRINVFRKQKRKSLMDIHPAMVENAVLFLPVKFPFLKVRKIGNKIVFETFKDIIKWHVKKDNFSISWITDKTETPSSENAVADIKSEFFGPMIKRMKLQTTIYDLERFLIEDKDKKEELLKVLKRCRNLEELEIRCRLGDPRAFDDPNFYILVQEIFNICKKFKRFTYIFHEKISGWKMAGYNLIESMGQQQFTKLGDKILSQCKNIDQITIIDQCSKRFASGRRTFEDSMKFSIATFNEELPSWQEHITYLNNKLN